MSEQHEIVASSTPHHHVDDSFLPFLQALQDKVSEVLAANAHYQVGPNSYALIGHSAVSGDELYKTYLESFPTQGLRQDHTCSCCKQFFRNYGNLVVIAPNGATSSLLFNDSDAIPAEYLDFVAHARALLDNSKVERVHYAASKFPVIGQLHKGTFNHFAFTLPGVLRFPNVYISSNQNSAETAEDLRLFSLSLHQWSDDHVAKAAAMFKHDADLSRTSWTEVLEKFQEIRTAYKSFQSREQRSNYLLAQVVQNRKGLARIGQTVLGEFLNNLGSEGVSDAQAKRMFLTMVDPKDYLRPKASPTQQTVEAAEKIVAQLDLKDALRRRALRRDELDGHTVWDKPADEAPAANEGVFGHLKTKDQASKPALPSIDGGRISLTALMDKIDDDVSKIEVNVAYVPTKAFSSFVTEAVAGSRPILNWDHEDRRNPVSTYTYSNPVLPSHWGVSGGWNEVVAITDMPQRWEDHSDEAFTLDPHFVLTTGYDRSPANLPLFPANLRPELHQVRSVIEAYAKAAKLEEREQGLVVWQYAGGEQLVRLTTKDAVVTYRVVSDK
jgi:hypothetical protein